MIWTGRLGNGTIRTMQVTIKHGSVLCARCDASMTAEVCPRCRYTSAAIKVGYNGRKYRYYLDDDLRPYTYKTAVATLVTINREIEARAFDPESRLREVIQARRFHAAWDEWMTMQLERIEIGEFAYSTWYMYQTHFSMYLWPIVGDRDVRLIDDETIDGLKMAVKDKSRKYKINVFATLHSFMNWLKNKKHWIKELPQFPDWKGRPLAQSRRRESLTVEEQEAEFAKIPERHRDIFVFAAEVGCRPGEAGLIRLEDVTRNGILILKRTFSRYHEMDRTKENANRAVPLSKLALEILAAHRLDPETGEMRIKGRVFVNPDGRPAHGPYRPAFLSKLWRNTVGYDMPDLYAAIRTSFSTQIAETGGMSEKEWERLTGHSGHEAADRYYTPTQNRQREIINSRRRNKGKVVSFPRTGSDGSE